MLEDTFLVWQFKRGSRDALRKVYEKYLNYLLTLAMALLNDDALAQDVVHDVFVSLARSAGTIKTEGSLKGYLGKSVANRARDYFRKRGRRVGCLPDGDCLESGSPSPAEVAESDEVSRKACEALARLPVEQREAIALRLSGGMKFAEIAGVQGVSVNTVQGRYRYGIEKLRSILSEEKA